ncbi:MAG: hypothetical protein F4X65_06635 [Chloroflexi bacterium]|nr:hypothetical protein [Chloroflexota bacterium]
MADSTEQDKKFKLGIGGWVRMILVGIVCAALLPIMPNLVISIACGGGALCFLVDNPLIISVIAAAIGLAGGMLVVYAAAKHAHRKRFQDPSFGPEVTLESRKGDAWIGYLNQYGRDRHGGR